MSASLVPLRSPQERLERFVGDCTRIIIQARLERVGEYKEQALKDALKLLPDIEPESP